MRQVHSADVRPPPPRSATPSNIASKAASLQGKTKPPSSDRYRSWAGSMVTVVAINRVAGDHSRINAGSLFCLKRQLTNPVPADRRSLFLRVLKFTEKVRSAGFQALFRIFCNRLALFLENHPVFGSHMTAHTARHFLTSRNPCKIRLSCTPEFGRCSPWWNPQAATTCHHY